MEEPRNTRKAIQCKRRRFGNSFVCFVYFVVSIFPLHSSAFSAPLRYQIHGHGCPRSE